MLILFILIAARRFGPYWPYSGGIQNYFRKLLTIGDGQQGPKHVAAIKYKLNKQLLKLLQGTVLLVTLIIRAT
jgi:hypothetical protein